VSELAAVYKEVDPKGEVVLVIAGAEKSTVSESELSDAARKLRASGNSPRDVMEHLMSGLGAPRNLAYKLAHESEP
jgi:16S rRNA C1402 (ribose-2'-O) methylase RsmI